MSVVLVIHDSEGLTRPQLTTHTQQLRQETRIASYLKFAFTLVLAT